MTKVIYDFGSNNGDDIPYYLKKSDLVIAVEANPQLCEFIEERYSSEIKEGKLVVECCVITDGDTTSEVPFYLHKEKHVLSQFPVPPADIIDDFEKVMLRSNSVDNILKTYGEPYYIKIDIEQYDAQILKALFNAKVSPEYISAESHSIEIFYLLAIVGNYNAFKFVEGSRVEHMYSNHKIETEQGQVDYSFPHHSAGPFGDDINGEWMTADVLLKKLTPGGLGWVDIHATMSDDIQVKNKMLLKLHIVKFVALTGLKSFARSTIRPLVPDSLVSLLKGKPG